MRFCSIRFFLLSSILVAFAQPTLADNNFVKTLSVMTLVGGAAAGVGFNGAMVHFAKKVKDLQPELMVSYGLSIASTAITAATYAAGALSFICTSTAYAPRETISFGIMAGGSLIGALLSAGALGTSVKGNKETKDDPSKASSQSDTSTAVGLSAAAFTAHAVAFLGSLASYHNFRNID